jgi:hypothetical protein
MALHDASMRREMNAVARIGRLAAIDSVNPALAIGCPDRALTTLAGCLLACREGSRMRLRGDVVVAVRMCA